MMAMTAQIRLFTFLIISLCSGVGFAWDKTIRVSNDGEDAGNCGLGSRGRPCRTLDRALDTAFQNGPDSTLISIQAGLYTLGKKLNFTGVQDFAIVGHDGVEIRCSANVSFHFVLSDTIAIEGVHLHRCGDWHLSSVGSVKRFRPVIMRNVKFLTAMNFVYCRNIRLLDVRISETAGLAVNLYDVGGEVNFTNCFFTDNIARPSSNSTPHMSEGYANAGGGIFLILNVFGYSPVVVDRSKHETFLHNNTYIFRNCTFLRNEAPKPGLKDHFDTPQAPFSRGGGLGIYFRGRVRGCRIQIRGCSFLHNRAHWGGGLQVEFRDSSENNVLSVEDTEFEGNFAQFAGGGARVGNILTRGMILAQNRFTFERCLFRNNSAVWGGAVGLYGTSGLVDIASSNASFIHNKQFSFSKSRFLGNTGTVGSALGVYLFNRNEAHIGPEVPFHVEIHDCDVIGNDVIANDETVITGEGAIYSLEGHLTLSGHVTIGNNSNTALSLDGATVEINGRVLFVNNSGFRGGAVAMYGRSRLRLLKNSSLVFRENRCEEKGGALYVDIPGAPGVNFNGSGLVNRLCFFAYEDPVTDFDQWNATLEFQGNVAANEESGRAVYATTLKTCRRIGEPRFNNSVLEWKFVKFFDSAGVETNAREEISTDPIEIIFDPADWSVAPNELFNATLKLLDEKGQNVFGIVHVEIEPVRGSSATVKLISPSSLFLADESISFVRLAGKSGDEFNVNLRSIGQQVLYKQISGVSLRPCHPGFYLKGTECVCADSTEEGVARCSKDGKTTFLKRNFWGGRVDGKFATYRCPYNYCKCSKPSVDHCMYVPGQMCGDHRNQSSILCGSCQRGYGVKFGSEVCTKDCTNLYLLLLPVYGIVLVIVVMVIMVIDLDAFTGYLNAWLYSYQVVSFLIHEDFAFDPVMTFIIYLVNFQFRTGGSGSCLAAGLDEADKLAISYVMPVFLLVVIIVLVKIIGAFPNWCFSKRVHAPFRAFCTLAVISYTIITGISLKILHPAIVNGRVVLFQNGELDFFAGKHIVYAAIAIFFVSTFVLPFPLVLMFRSYCTKCLRPVFNMNRLKPIFDALQSCFKDDKRWFAAFYFVCRLAILVVATYVPSGPVRRILLQTICTVTLAIFAFLKPYKQGRVGEESYNWINKSDAVLLTNLALIAIFSGAIGQSADTDSVLKIFVDLFAYVPLIVLAVVAYRLVKKRRSLRNAATVNSPRG